MEYVNAVCFGYTATSLLIWATAWLRVKFSK